MRESPSIVRLFLWGTVLVILTLLVYLGVLSVALEKLGISGPMISLLVWTSIIGSMVNIPLFTLISRDETDSLLRGHIMRDRFINSSRPVTIAINIGGGLIPTLFSLYLILQQSLPFYETLAAVSVVSAVSYFFSFVIPGIGVGTPILIAPVSAALVALSLNPDQAPALAYVCGTLGVLVGADLLRLGEIKNMHPNFASIGGAGTFDGVFLTGIIAVLLT